jgi:hypothetical protein
MGGNMEGMENEGHVAEVAEPEPDIFSRLPIVGRLARTAFQLVDSQLHRERIIRADAERLEMEELAITRLSAVVPAEMEHFQTQQIIYIKAKQTLKHIALDDDEVGGRVQSLWAFMREFAEGTKLKDVGLSFEEADTLRIYMDKYCTNTLL